MWRRFDSENFLRTEKLDKFLQHHRETKTKICNRVNGNFFKIEQRDEISSMFFGIDNSVHCIWFGKILIPVLFAESACSIGLNVQNHTFKLFGEERKILELAVTKSWVC